MKVLNLQCGAQHVFEGWFSSHEDYASQLERGLLTCPMCGDAAVHKLPSAPRIQRGASRPQADEAAVNAASAQKQQVVGGEAADKLLQAAWLQVARHIMDKTEDVGERFAEEARRMHYGEAKERGIRGQASRAETEALLEEGIEVRALPLPDLLKNSLQ